MSGPPYSYGRNSQREFDTLHTDLQIVMTHVLETVDVSLVQGRRTVETQIVNIRNRASRTINSYHITRDARGFYDPDEPSLAVDFKPYRKGTNPYALDSDPRHIREKKKARFYYIQGIIREIARRESIVIVQGVDWDMDGDFFDQSFDDLGHVQLVVPNRPKLALTDDELVRANEALGMWGLPKYKNPV